MAKDKKLDYETALSTLATLVEEMEKGDLSLDLSLEKFEQGIGLIRQCQDSLNELETKVAILMNGKKTAFSKTAED